MSWKVCVDMRDRTAAAEATLENCCSSVFSIHTVIKFHFSSLDYFTSYLKRNFQFWRLISHLELLSFLVNLSYKNKCTLMYLISELKRYLYIFKSRLSTALLDTCTVQCHPRRGAPRLAKIFENIQTFATFWMYHKPKIKRVFSNIFAILGAPRLRWHCTVQVSNKAVLSRDLKM